MKKYRGFTFVELLIVVAIVGIIAAIAIPSIQRARQSNALRQQGALAVCNPQDLGAGVWYFTCNASGFASALAQFRKEHDDLRIVTLGIASGREGQYAATVVTELRQPAERPY